MKRRAAYNTNAPKVKRCKFKLVEVTCADMQSCGGWRMPGEGTPYERFHIYGLLVGDDKEYITLMAGVAEPYDEENMDEFHHIWIPRGAIKKMTTVAIKEIEVRI